MKYIMKVVLISEKSFETRKMLDANGFTICRLEKPTGHLDVVHEDYGDEEKIVYLSDAYEYQCLYNGATLPSQEVFRRTEEDPAVLDIMYERHPN